MITFSWLKGRLPICLMLVVSLVCIPSFVLAEDVDVYAQGAYNDTTLDLYIYADINVGPILSFGVRVDYPAALTLNTAEKNEADWFFGEGGPDHAYMDPEVDVAGRNAVIIGGKLDTTAGHEADGVDGMRVLLATVSFTHGGGITDSVAVSLTYGRGDGTGDYKNFVDTVGNVKDGAGVSFDVEIHERGDANGNGSISTADYIIIRNSIGSTDAPPWVDCNRSGDVSTADYICVRNKI